MGRSIALLRANDFSSDRLAELTPEEFAFSQQSITDSVVTPPRFAPASEAITMQLQAWTNELHKLLIAGLKDSGKNADIPRPNIVVNLGDGMGAHLSAVTLCINVPFSFGPQASSPDEIHDKALGLDSYSKSLNSERTNMTYSNAPYHGHDDSRCLERPYHDPRTRLMIQRFLSDIQGCHVTFEETLVRLSTGCSTDLAAQHYRGEQIQLDLPSNWIDVKHSMFPHLTSEQVIGVLMHELVHYYMISTNTADYNVYYNLDAMPIGTRPKEWKDKGSLIEEIKTSALAYQSDHEDAQKRSRYQMAIQQGDRNHIGWYTNEEEADDLGLEWLTMLGIEPLEMSRSFLQLMTLAEQDPNHSVDLIADVDAKTCQKLLERRFRSDSGERIYVSIGDYDEPHHNHCYRIANLNRQIELYGFMKQPLPASLHSMTDTEWKAAVDAL
ncbi:MAG: hypothetical protein NTZ90_09170 [Proteobacteria bacterium]|nr:hypothetical protein [Pseudomonadota bacterium]